jgi:hypothetical protein
MGVKKIKTLKNIKKLTMKYNKLVKDGLEIDVETMRNKIWWEELYGINKFVGIYGFDTKSGKFEAVYF